MAHGVVLSLPRISMVDVRFSPGGQAEFAICGNTNVTVDQGRRFDRSTYFCNSRKHQQRILHCLVGLSG